MLTEQVVDCKDNSYIVMTVIVLRLSDSSAMFCSFFPEIHNNLQLKVVALFVL